MNFIQNTMKKHCLCDKAMAPCQSSYLRFETYFQIKWKTTETEWRNLQHIQGHQISLDPQKHPHPMAN